MELLALSVKDIVRRKGKNIYVALAVVIPVAILCTIVLTMDNANTSLANVASKFGFTLTVQPKNIQVKKINQIGIVLDEYLSESVADSALEIIEMGTGGERGQITVAPRIYIQTELQFKEKSFPLIVAGIDSRAENEARPAWGIIPSQWQRGGSFIFLGGALAEAKKLYHGDTVIINNSSFEVAGILENYNSAEDYMAFLPIGVAQELFDKRGLFSVLNIQDVALDRDSEVLRQVLLEINNGIPNIRAITPQQFSAIKYVMLKKTFKFLLSIIIATVAISIFSIFNIITGVLYSRVKEIGMYKIAGASRGQLLKIILYEYCIIGFLGGSIGYPVGMLMASMTDTFLLDIGISARFSFSFMITAIVMGVVCSLAASIWPTMKLSAIKINEAFRTQWET